MSRLASTFKFLCQLRFASPQSERTSTVTRPRSCGGLHRPPLQQLEHETVRSDRADPPRGTKQASDEEWKLYCLHADDEGRRQSQVSQTRLTTTQPCLDGGNCWVTPHMNTPKSDLSLVHSGKVHYSDNQRHKIAIVHPHGNSNCRSDCMESGVSDNLLHVTAVFH